ncbi:MAG TPA: hypothetical protein VN706_22125 [Gemmatimonadaceae bacterium]|nr:hypothetical protein [Gemmatimonadaceae bacterium]
MRALLRLTCAAALVACSDVKTPTAVTQPLRSPLLPTPHADSVSGAIGRLDGRPIPDRVAELVSQRFAKVSLPADSYSAASDAVHPDIACPPRAWNGAACWLMYTPYKNSNSTYENPGVLIASTDTSWRTPPSITNPIVPFPGVGAYNSDPDHAFDPGTGRLVQVYRVVADSFNKIMIMSTADARTWTAPRVAFKERNHDAVSPSLIIDANRGARLWYVRSGADGCSSQSSSVQMRTAQPDSSQRFEQTNWSEATPVDLKIPNSVVWHLDVSALPGDAGYVALVVAFRDGTSCGYSDLWLAASPDGIHWRTYAMPIFWRTMKLASQRAISTWYRGTVRYDAGTDSLHLWPSALAGTAWTIYHTAVKLRDIRGLLEQAQPSDYKSLFNLRSVPGTAALMP